MADSEGETRHDRRKRRTRGRLLQAGFILVANRGIDAVSIQEITDAADVAFGTFYNHFPSKEAIYDAIVDEFLEDFGNALDEIGADISDPPEVVALSIRHTLRRSEQDPDWGRLLLREGFSLASMARGLGPRLKRDIEQGLAAGRFATADPSLAVLSAGGTVLAAIAAQLHAPRLAKLDMETDHLPERTASAVLRALGVPKAEADNLAQLPLPNM
ncbi:MAG: TetR/AcrR family transcriptional regulator [Myxococcota bacterium]